MMIDIAKRPGTDLVSLSRVAENTQISKRYLDQLALALKVSSLMRSMRVPVGLRADKRRDRQGIERHVAG
jgi:DNA-binding IscR family transcriptional regulator